MKPKNKKPKVVLQKRQENISGGPFLQKGKSSTPFLIKASDSQKTLAQKQGKEKPIQAKYYTTDASKNRPGLKGNVNVETSKGSVDLKGKLIGKEGEGINVSGTVYMPEYKTSVDRSKAPTRIRDNEGSSWDNYWNPADALRVANLTANPRGMKLGQLLTYYHGLEAQRRSKPYVIAMNVSDARGPFYAPLGFKDYNGSRQWADLQKRLVFLESSLRDPQSKLEKEEVSKYVNEAEALKMEMKDSSMIIKTGDLIANSKLMFEQVWKAG